MHSLGVCQRGFAPPPCLYSAFVLTAMQGQRHTLMLEAPAPIEGSLSVVSCAERSVRIAGGLQATC
jgi:hypothetical protein